MSEEPDTDLISVGVCQIGAESDWRVANSESIKGTFTEENGYQLYFEDAQQKQENQFRAIRRFIQQQVDYIVLMPITETGWESVLQEAREAGIPVILVDRMVDVEDETLYATHIGSDFLQEGRTAMDWLEQRTPEGKPLSIMHIRGTMDSSAQQGRSDALEEALGRHPDWTLLTRLDGDFTQAKAYEVVNEFLAGQPEPVPIDVVYCENDNEAFGTIQALEENGYPCGPEGVTVISFDATTSGLELCAQGKIALEVECNPLLGPLVEQAIRTLEQGGTLPRQQYVEEKTFTPSQVTESLLAGRTY
ncbi:sugar-binding domain protein [Subdoligranulum variabile DSM 15176]|uniref:Sugar-binding domain protein n=1 Tax=Subdoligranulum variabile DSM 15176 TaxID=411471 RepID=D1PQX8_9FIRM|nr:sugar-binding domain protein [Subdoligranulum variabile DSM 15176]